LQPSGSGAIDVSKEFDAVLLVLLSENFEAILIYESDWTACLAAVATPGSRARHERGDRAKQRCSTPALPSIGDRES
jgi:hypothetical protein